MNIYFTAPNKVKITATTNLKLNTVIEMITNNDVTSFKWFELFNRGGGCCRLQAVQHFRFNYEMINKFYRFCSHVATNSLICFV